jgi:prolyl-tRNA editing enzyme YbaK/EbsC (Cys-tRNA(Pro) deacylase)
VNRDRARRAARTAQHAAAALGVDVGAIANSLVFLLDGDPAR